MLRQSCLCLNIYLLLNSVFLVTLGHGHRKGEAEPLHTKMTLVRHQPHRQVAQICVLRNSHPSFPGQGNSFMTYISRGGYFHHRHNWLCRKSHLQFGPSDLHYTNI